MEVGRKIKGAAARTESDGSNSSGPQ